MKLCKDCKHFQYKWIEGQLCRSPKIGVNLITGKTDKRYATTMRKDYKDNSESCGTEGNWWEPKPIKPPKTFWAKIFGVKE